MDLRSMCNNLTLRDRLMFEKEDMPLFVKMLGKAQVSQKRRFCCCEVRVAWRTGKKPLAPGKLLVNIPWSP